MDNLPIINLNDIPQDVVDFYLKSQADPAQLIKALSTVAMVFNKDIDNEGLLEMTNNIGSTLDTLKKALFRVLVAKGIQQADAISFIESLSHISKIAGGISFADFHITESMARLADEEGK